MMARMKKQFDNGPRMPGNSNERVKASNRLNPYSQKQRLQTAQTRGPNHQKKASLYGPDGVQHLFNYTIQGPVNMWAEPAADADQSSSGEKAKDQHSRPKPAQKYNDEEFFVHYSNPQNTSNLQNTSNPATSNNTSTTPI